MSKSKYIWQDLIDVCNELNISFVNCPTTNLNESIYNASTPNVWFFKCHCGKEFTAKPSFVIIKHKKSCGCLSGCIRQSKHCWQDLIDVCNELNISFVNCPTTNLNESIYKIKKYDLWMFRCFCDNTFSTSIYSILSGNTTSCGCNASYASKYTWQDLLITCKKSNLIFLHPITNLSKKIYNTQLSGIWYFRCACGKIITPSLTHIMQENTKGCGCNRRGYAKYIWQDVIYACNKADLIFLANVNLDSKVFDVLNTKRWPIQCHCGNKFTTRINDIIYNKVRSCGCIRSFAQTEVEDFIKTLGIDFVRNTRKVIPPLELDIYIPDKQIAIEYCGLYWHGEVVNQKFAPKKHIDKLKLCKEKGIRLITIFENEWLFRREQVRGYLIAILGKAKNKIYARKCEIYEISNDKAKLFHDDNHIQGPTNGSHLGLYFNNELVSMATFSVFNNRKISKKNNAIIELTRYTIKINYSVAGGFAKLLSHFIKTNKYVEKIISYSDNRWSEGRLYQKNGFIKEKNIMPTYYYFDKSSHLYNKSKFMKNKIKLKYPEIDITKTENDIMALLKYDKIWDCGKIRWAYNHIR